MIKQRLIFIDRDGTLLVEPQDNFQVDSLEKFELIPGCISALKQLVQLGYTLVMVTNQDGLGTEAHPENLFWPYQNLLIQILKSEGLVFDAVLMDRSFPEDNLPTRKPGTGLLTKYLNNPYYDLENSWVIGDRETDVQLAHNIQAKGIFLQHEQGFELGASNVVPNAVNTFVAPDWEAISDIIQKAERKASWIRNTGETQIRCAINLEGGERTIQTGLPFLDHMLDQIGKHGGIGLDLQAQGDLEIDEHHTMEDVAIVFGEVLREALWNKIGIQRFGFALPMDDAGADVRIDLSNRPYLVWELPETRSEIGGIPFEMFEHFFRSIADEARLNLHIKAYGKNTHHIIESVFKGFGRALNGAIKKLPNDYSLPSTKGKL